MVDCTGPGNLAGSELLSSRSNVLMKQISAICFWAIGAWLVLSIVLPFVLPAPPPTMSSAPPGTTVLFRSDSGLSMVAGTFALVLGLLGLLPGTNSEDDENNGG